MNSIYSIGKEYQGGKRKDTLNKDELFKKFN